MPTGTLRVPEGARISSVYSDHHTPLRTDGIRQRHAHGDTQRVTLSVQPCTIFCLTPKVPAWLCCPPGWKRAWDPRRASFTEHRGERNNHFSQKRCLLDFSSTARTSAATLGERERRVKTHRPMVSLSVHGSHSPRARGRHLTAPLLINQVAASIDPPAGRPLKRRSCKDRPE